MGWFINIGFTTVISDTVLYMMVSMGFNGNRTGVYNRQRKWTVAVIFPDTLPWPYCSVTTVVEMGESSRTSQIGEPLHFIQRFDMQTCWKNVLHSRYATCMPRFVPSNHSKHPCWLVTGDLVYWELRWIKPISLGNLSTNQYLWFGLRLRCERIGWAELCNTARGWTCWGSITYQSVGWIEWTYHGFIGVFMGKNFKKCGLTGI